MPDKLSSSSQEGQDKTNFTSGQNEDDGRMRTDIKNGDVSK
jgi:hypothetical protein